MTLFIIVSIAIIGFAIIFMNSYPHFGKKLTKSQRQKFTQSPNYSGGKFVNQAANEDKILQNMFSMLRDFIKANPDRRPKIKMPMVTLDTESLGTNSAQVTWLGHSSSILELDGKLLLLDPMLGKTPSPFPKMATNKRYSDDIPVDLEKLALIDVVILSHDHYDHLDYNTIVKLKDKVKQFFVPLGVGAHLERWGIRQDRIQELDWWDTVDFEGITLAATPARHFSGRNLHDRDATLWCSWVIMNQSTRIFFSGDGGYGTHFNEIGAKFGPFDLTLIECGQYDERWASIHMLPEQSVQAHVDLKGKKMIPIHWGAFTLSFHSWTDPVERAIKASKAKGVQILTPRIGESVAINAMDDTTSTWWK